MNWEELRKTIWLIAKIIIGGYIIIMSIYLIAGLTIFGIFKDTFIK